MTSARCPCPPGRHRDTGQAVVELALALPVVCVLLAMVLQVAVLGAHRLAIELAAREGARAASLVPDRSMSAVAMSAAGRSTALGPLDVDLRRAGGLVTVTVRYDDPTDVPLAGFLLPDVELTAAVTMAVEPPGTTADTDNVAGDAAGGT
ncbi:MAG: hypothetical protein RLZ04_1937 [Actinomycetota bacterium]